MKLYLIAIRNIRRNRRRSILSIIATALAAMCMVFLFSYIAGIENNLKNNIQTYYTGEVRIRHKDFDKNEQLNPLHLNIGSLKDTLSIIDRERGIKSVSPRISFPAAIYKQDEKFGAMGLGVDFAREGDFQDLATRLTDGRFPEAGKNEALLGRGLAKELGVTVGGKITLISSTIRGGINAITFKVTGIASFPETAFDKKYLLAPIDRVQYFLRMGDAATEVLVKLGKGADLDKAESDLNAALSEAGLSDITAKAWTHINTSLSVMKLGTAVFNFFAIFFFLLASTVIINTTMMVIFERTREIGTIGAMGMTGGEIVRLFFLEAAYLGFLGSLIGCALGIALTLPLSITGINMSSVMEGMSFEISDVVYPALNWGRTIQVFFYSFVIAALSSLIPSRRAARIKPVEALRSL